MNKAIMIAIQPKWSNMIKEGTKTFEFRNYAIPKGTKVYLYESKGRQVQWEISQHGKHFTVLDNTLFLKNYRDSGFDIKAFHEGQGAVVAEFVVGECYEVVQDEKPTNFLYTLTPIDVVESIEKFDCAQGEDYRILGDVDELELKPQGYTNQKYAHTITDLIVYDEEWQDKKWNEINNKSKVSILQLDEKELDYMFHKLSKKFPTSPIPVTEFVSWNKLIKFDKQFPNYHEGTEHIIEKYVGINNEQYDTVTNYNFPKEEFCKLTHAPQGRVYVVERGNE